MKKLFFLFLLSSCCNAFGQDISLQLKEAFQRFEADSQLSNGIASLCVIDAKTGKVMFDKNSTIGLAPASTQKIITGATAYEVLGKDFRYKTELTYDGRIEKDVLKGNIYLLGSGDPTLGSWRWKTTSDSVVLKQWYESIKHKGIKTIDGVIQFDGSRFSMKGIPDGWMWQDIGNYYGAGAYILNWKENQYELKLKSGTQVGSDVEVVSKDKAYLKEIKAAPKGTGDNAYIYLPVGNQKPLLAGTIPVEEKAFTISGATPDPVNQVISDLSFFLKAHGIRTVPGVTPVYYEQPGKVLKTCTSIDQYYSPPMDSIIYWFFKKSINLYGEALVKTIAYQKEGFGATDKGVAFIKKYWKEKGIPPTELNMVDGSGLSPLNRVTTHAQTSILQYAKQQPWFAGFYEALPEYNGMKIKSGTINGAKAFCGYHTSKEGKEYIFSFIVNNYNGSASAVVKKMYTVLDILK